MIDLHKKNVSTTLKEEDFPRESGTYALVFFNSEQRSLEVGALGDVKFNKGFYIYIGSAFGPGGLRGRLRHHLLPISNPRWHVDYLRPEMTLQEVRFVASKTRNEHNWAHELEKLPEASIPQIGFGSSDCGCRTHLFYFTQDKATYPLVTRRKDSVMSGNGT